MALFPPPPCLGKKKGRKEEEDEGGLSLGVFLGLRGFAFKALSAEPTAECNSCSSSSLLTSTVVLRFLFSPLSGCSATKFLHDNAHYCLTLPFLRRKTKYEDWTPKKKKEEEVGRYQISLPSSFLLSLEREERKERKAFLASCLFRGRKRRRMEAKNMEMQRGRRGEIVLLLPFRKCNSEM